MAETRSNALTFTAALAAVGLLTGSLAGRSGRAPEPAAPAQAQAAAKEPAPAALPSRFSHMGIRLLLGAMGYPHRIVGPLADSTLSVMVATVPDPADSHEDWAFDANLEAIRRAHEREGYAATGMWLPWSVGGDSVLKDADKSRVRHLYPGVLLFRSSDPAPASRPHPRFRMVYLVGEVPTAGVHPLALDSALAERDLLLDPSPEGGGTASDTLRILGPTFSGSGPELAGLLSRWREKHRLVTVKVVTGSATGTANARVFSDSGFTFAATVNSDDALRRVLSGEVLNGLGIEPDELAILTEGSTAYGAAWGKSKLPEEKAVAQASQLNPKVDTAPARHAVGAGAVRAPKPQQADPDTSSHLKEPELFLSFPMNIGTLRDEYADRLRAARQPPQEGGTGVSLSLTDGARPMETPIVQSRLTAASVGLMLDEISATLRSHDIRAVAIAATDVRDRLFLASELRSRLRDVQFIALENNALYLAPEYNRDLRGMLVLSSYPLLTETQLWGGGKRVVPFSSEFAEGIYNAALLQLGSYNLLDYRFRDGHPGPQHPPVWISTVGTGVLAPLFVDTAGLGYVAAVDPATVSLAVHARGRGRTAADVRAAATSLAATPDPRFDFLSGVLLFAILALAGWFMHSCGKQLGAFPATVDEDADSFREQLDGLRPLAALGGEMAQTPRDLTPAEHGQLRPLALPYRAAAAIFRSHGAGEAASLEAAEAEALTELGKDDWGGRSDVLAARRAEWGALRCQEALYRFIFGAAVLGGLVPGTVLIGWATLRAYRDLPHAPMLVAAVALASFVAGCARAALDATRLRHLSRTAWWTCGASLGVLAVTGLYGAWGLETRLLVPAGAVVLAGAALLVLSAALLTALISFVFWTVVYLPVMRTCRVRRHPHLDLWRLNVWARRLVLLLGFAYVGLIAAYAAEIVRVSRDPVRFTLLFHRAWRVDGGISPIFPLGLAAVAFAIWARWHLRRVRTLRQVTAFEAACLAIDTVAPAGAYGDPNVAIDWSVALPRRAVQGVRQVRDRLTRLVPDTRALALFAVLALAGLCIAVTRYHSMEHLAGIEWFDTIYRFGLIAMVATTAWAVYRLLGVWKGLNRTLRAIAGTPLVTAFERLPRRISRLTRLVFLGTPQSRVVAPVAAAQWRHLRSLSERFRPTIPAKKIIRLPAPVVVAVAPDGGVAPVAVGGGVTGAAAGHDAAGVRTAPARALDPEARLRAGLVAYASLPEPRTSLGRWGEDEAGGENLLALMGVLEEFWKHEPRATEIDGVRRQVEEHGASGEPAPSTSGRIRRTAGDDMALWFRAAEEFAAVQVVDYVEGVINQMRVLALFIFASLLLVTLHESAYPYQPQSLMKLVLFALLVGTVGALVKVMLDMNRDEILSRVARTEPGKITWDMHFVLNLLVFGLVPLVSLIGSEFPAVREFLFAWIYPVSRLLGGGG